MIRTLTTSVLNEVRSILKVLWFENQEVCVLCGKKGQTVCNECQNSYFSPKWNRCLGCGKIISGKDKCYDCESGKGPGLQGVTTIGHYRGAWKSFIHTFKYMGQPYLLIPLSDYLSTWAAHHLPIPDYVVPVPMHQERLAQRGFNQAEVIASILSRKLGLTCVELLNRTIHTQSQISLGRQERIENLSGVFEIKSGTSVEGKVVWIVDDVITTGTTVGECAKVLKAAGAKEVFGFCLGAGKEEL